MGRCISCLPFSAGRLPGWLRRQLHVQRLQEAVRRGQLPQHQPPHPGCLGQLRWVLPFEHHLTLAVLCSRTNADAEVDK